MSEDRTIYLKEKENPPRKKEAHSTLTVTISSEDPELQKSIDKIKPPTLKFPMSLVQKVEGPYDIDDNLVEELVIGEIYTYKATKFKDSTFTPIKHIWWAEQLDDGKIVDLKYEKDENPYLDENGYVCYDYEVKECKKVRIYAYMAKPIKKVSIENKIITKKIITFFIGGAGDKESYYKIPASKIMEGVEINFKNRLDESISKYYQSKYLGYNEVKGDEDIKENVLSIIPNKENTVIYIIGHSLGGWNGAHLSEILSNKGYNVDLLVTLDPVGTKVGVTLFSDIYWNKPKPKVKHWINIFTNPKENDIDDWIAFGGGQWKPSEGVTINDDCNCHHRSAELMLTKSLKNSGVSASDSLIDLMKLFISKHK